MNPAVKDVRLTPLDYLLSVMDNTQAPLDFTIIFHFNRNLDLNALRRGAQSARRTFPTTGCRLFKNSWTKNTWVPENAIETASCCDDSRAIENFVNRPFDLERDFPVRQLVNFGSNSGTLVVTRFHHAVADGMSAALWLRHQLEVAYGIAEVVNQTDDSHSPPALKSVTSFVRKSRFAYQVPSDRLITSSAVRSGVRAWETMVIDAIELRRLIRKIGGFTYSDLLATCALEVYAQWNQQQQSSVSQKISLWLPINVRQRSTEGFGNGTSRIRIYATYPKDVSLIEKCREVRRQIEWCTAHGEWVVPDIKAVTYLPRTLMRPVLRHSLTRSSIDMATGVFSHADRWNSSRGGVFDAV
ncbi:MAG TPA: hypothetical protein VF251_13565, partial [Pyrinomonadaceae bacterium]